MTEDQNTPEMPDLSATTGEDVAAAANEIEVPTALKDVDPAKLAALKAKLAAFISGRGKTTSGSEAPTDEVEAQQEAEMAAENQGPAPGAGTRLPTGKDVDWSEYDLEFNVRHLYPRALLRQTPEGVKWVAMLDEFHSTVRSGKNHGKKVNMPGTTDGEHEEPLNLGEYLNSVINGPEGWRIAAILPASGGDATVLLQRQAPYILPDPKPLAQEENPNEVAPPTDEELARTEAAALEFAAGEGLEAPPVEQPEVLHDSEGNEITGQEEVPGPSPIFIKEPLPEARVGLLDRINLALNPGEEAPQAGGQPDALDLDTNVVDLGQQVREEDGSVKRVIAPGVENVRQGLRNLLDGPDFGTV